MSKLFDVCPRSTVEEMEQQEEVRVAWGTGIAGHVAESGEPVNIPDAYQVSGKVHELARGLTNLNVILLPEMIINQMEIVKKKLKIYGSH